MGRQCWKANVSWVINGIYELICIVTYVQKETSHILIVIFIFCLLKAPNPPNELQVVVANGTFKLIWNLPAIGIFVIKSYKISYTCNDWEDKCDIVINATESSCIIPNILPEKTYKFKIASCLENSYEGNPSVETLYYSECKFDEIVMQI